MDGTSFRAAMARKVFGVPVMVFVLIGAAVVLYFAWKMKSTPDTTGDVAEEVPATDGGPDDFSQQPDFFARPDTPSATPVVTTTATNDTNDLWKRRAIEWLLGNGYSLEVSTNSVSKYLNGDPLTDRESKARNAVVGVLGLPPEDIPDVIHKSANHTNRLSDAPASAQGRPPLNHTVKGKHDDTPSELAVLYFGTNNADAVNKITAANATKSIPYVVGIKVHIPEHYYPHYYRSTGHTNTLYEIARKNGVPAAKVEQLNPGMDFPVKVGTRVRVK